MGTLRVLFGICGILIALTICGCSKKTNDPIGGPPALWQTMQSGTTATLGGVWGTSHSDVFAFGDSGTILHYDGANWAPMISGTTAGLGRAFGFSGSDIFAVGCPNTILHYDGAIWTPYTKTNSWHYDFAGVWGASPTDVFVVGADTNTYDTKGIILHYDGSSWSLVSGNEDFPCLGIWGDSSSDIFVVGGSYGAATVLHYNGSAWTPMDLSGLVADGDAYDTSVSAVWGVSASDIYMLGMTIDNYNNWFGVMFQSNGTGWSYVGQANVLAIWGASASDIFAVGGEMLHFDGNSWRSISAGAHGRPFAVWGSSASDVFAVGENGLILHYGGDQ